jgi:hypothetical protein
MSGPSVPAEETVPLSYLARALHEEGSKELPSVVQICAQLAAKEDDPSDHFVALLCSLLMPQPPVKLIPLRTLNGGPGRRPPSSASCVGATCHKLGGVCSTPI